ncbi:hypothetical protein H1164_17360 [Thermoactinomyces daqus]|uniref:Uncharacterized protein n=1 Tax=Thermoactinomyces daqus TaxID=1329516 RepID=A0A7W1XDL4_9BACL|nr:hypothetical protein [Thermoactinomyces daqus]MBA4544598.1 hypothetical protein [Thermoactinomyces daqus]
MTEAEKAFYEDVILRSSIVEGIRESKRRRRERLRQPILPFEYMPIPERPRYVKASEVTEFEIKGGEI